MVRLLEAFSRVSAAVQIKDEGDSHLWINSAYDPHTWLHGEQLTDGIEPVRSEELRVYPAVRAEGETRPATTEPLTYSWKGWDQPTYHEWKKESYTILKKAFEGYDEVAMSR